MLPTRLVLASRSPRRAQLLRDAGYAFEQIVPPFDDDASPPASAAADPEAAAIALARRKALSAREAPDADRLAGDRLVLSADTVVVDPEGAVVGTPLSIGEARTLISGLVNRRHHVVTGVALLHCGPGREDEQPVCFADTATVDVGRVGSQDLDDYLATGQWQGKAGGYNLFERTAAGWPICVEGDPTTVVGLPMVKLARHLGRWSLADASRAVPGPDHERTDAGHPGSRTSRLAQLTRDRSAVPEESGQ